MAANDKEKLQEFAQKMHDEGTAGFASGLTPWDTWDDFEERVGSRRTWQDPAGQVADRAPPKSKFGNRVLTTMTVLAVATLAIGIAGVYITQKPELQIAEYNTQLHSTAPSTTQELKLPAQGKAADRVETGLALNDASIPATGESPASPTAPGIRTIGTTEEPSGIQPGSNTTTPEPGTGSLAALVDPNALPAPAAGIPASAPANPGYNPFTNNLASGPAPASTMGLQAGSPETTNTNPANSSQAQPIQLARIILPDTHTSELLPPKQDITRPEPAGRSGDWSINLASYTKASTAAKMKNRFLEKGVTADQLAATVNGKTYYRLRVTGFETREAAIAQSEIIKKQLDLKDTWITKR